jgi:hypothetical protein
MVRSRSFLLQFSHKYARAVATAEPARRVAVPPTMKLPHRLGIAGGYNICKDGSYLIPSD